MKFEVAVLGLISASVLSISPGAVADPLPLSPVWHSQMPDGPDTTTKITEQYARSVARDAYFWAWPMINIYNRRLAFSQSPKVGLMNGVLPFAPINSMAMLSDYVKADQRWVACPNQDVVYGAGVAALEQTPMVLQVPDFGDRFWVYQIVDIRTDSFAQLGAMYGSKPGFYLLVGPDWKGEVPKGITKVFRAKTNTAFIVPRVFLDDTVEDREAIQKEISKIDMYSLGQFDGKIKEHDWRTLPALGSPTAEGGSAETKWVFPETFFKQLPEVMKDAPPLPGEEARYVQIGAVVSAAERDPALMAAMIEEAKKAEADLIDPLLQFRNWGVQLDGHWSTTNNNAAFGADYFTRTAVAKSNILVNAPTETKYFYQDLDANGRRLNGASSYKVTFPKDNTPPVHGFWSLTVYDAQHFFSPNELGCYSLGTKNKTLKIDDDGSLTIYVQPTSPGKDLETNWLPAPAGDFSLYLRAYWPKIEIVDGSWTPPSVRR
ncbi:DUF1254 domain-containing protein [Aliirhizobium cellulosilyticum]|uniref:DUF1254 domain-containing protein n=1 Tax=Aliirhizobium cellulosilyticum TaxID=393664 RepID=A0A7W6TJ46_9HYPH|nr:DUF1254 domain-containing protein [Rhizobium cellulosilyticum]MBB4351033.1 hypothetical protein [Rhizobium cellulosilyticum]MBB4414391.1 hypothetical protein [Rhizobium cellulosilyticum]MBB4449007.1 hypothetical protein [Rhizobium cellulosilyticum]